MRILLTGSSGLIGQALLPFLTSNGHKVVRLTRSPASGRYILWNPDAGTMNTDDLEDFEAIIHLAGESIVGRWTPEKKARILASRITMVIACAAPGSVSAFYKAKLL